MSTSTTANAVRWTTARIRKSILLPKPRNEIRKVYDLEHGRLVGQARPPIEQRLLQHFASHADLLDVPRPRNAPPEAPEAWLLVPAPRWLIDGLAVYKSDDEDLEPSVDGEPDSDREAEIEEGDYYEDHEPDGLVVTDAQRARYRRSVGVPISEIIGHYQRFIR